MSGSRLLHLDERTLIVGVCTSASGQQRTHAPQQKAFYSIAGDGDGGDSLRAAGEQIHPIADRRCVVRALTPSPSLLRGTRRRNVRLAEIGKIRAHQPHIGRHPIAEGRVRGQRENHVHRVVAEAAAVEGGKAE